MSAPYFQGEGPRTRRVTAAGSIPLVAGTATVEAPQVTPTAWITLSGSHAVLRVSARSPGTSFTILSADAGDNSLVYYEISEWAQPDQPKDALIRTFVQQIGDAVYLSWNEKQVTEIVRNIWKAARQHELG